jgi:hypothetical protein
MKNFKTQSKERSKSAKDYRRKKEAPIEKES